jgi:hypothetical protein
MIVQRRCPSFTNAHLGAAMNVFVWFLRDHPDAIDQLVEGERVSETGISIERLADVVEGFRFPLRFDREIISSLGEEPIGDLIGDAYLRVVSADRWRSRVEAAAPPPEINRTGRGEIEWVTFAGSGNGSYGVSLPSDDDAGTLRLSLFVPVDDSIRRVSIEYGEMEGPVGVSASVHRGCSLPDWGECRGGECGGDCELRRVHDDPDGLLCLCPHIFFDRLIW